MSRFIREALRELEPYTPGEQPGNKGLIKLNTNENPYPPAPGVMEALKKAVGQQNGQQLYPDPQAGEAVAAVAEYHGLHSGQVILGNGSDEILAFIYMAYGEEVIFPEVSYGFYPVFAGLFGSKGRGIPLDEKLAIRPEDYRQAGGTVVIANPNAPTGLALSLDEVAYIIEENRDNVVVIDEAYVDFGGDSAVPLIAKYDNLIVVQTFSKSRSLAGMRIGVAMGCETLIEDLNRIRYSFNPYNLSRNAIVAAKASIEEEEYFQGCINKIIKTREKTTKEMEKMGLSVLPSKANFIFVKSGRDYFRRLRENNILVRHFDKKPIQDYVRITIGTKEDMKRLVEVTRRIV